MKTSLSASLSVLLLAAAGVSTAFPQASTTKSVEPLNVHSQRFSVYPAASRSDLTERGHYGPSNNYPRKLGATDAFGQEGKLSLMADLNETVSYGSYQGIRLRLINRSGERATLSAIDSHLYIVQEALKDDGQWQAIEKTARGTGPRDCACGFHRVFLDPGEYWDLRAPRYAGSFKTKLRFKLDLGRQAAPYPKSGGVVIYSNDFEGSVNPEQLAADR